jgi:hypothetical protein
MLRIYSITNWWINQYLSASSRIIILWRLGGRVTFFCAKALILVRTTSIPLSRIRCTCSEWGETASWQLTSHPKHSTLKLLPYKPRPEVHELNSGCLLFCRYPASPSRQKIVTLIRGVHIFQSLTDIMMWGQFPSTAITFKRSIVSSFPTISLSVCGRNFSSLGKR